LGIPASSKKRESLLAVGGKKGSSEKRKNKTREGEGRESGGDIHMYAILQMQEDSAGQSRNCAGGREGRHREKMGVGRSKTLTHTKKRKTIRFA